MQSERTVNNDSGNLSPLDLRNRPIYLNASQMTGTGWEALLIATTTNLPEGTNLYFTDTRARAAIDGTSRTLSGLTITGFSGFVRATAGVLSASAFSDSDLPNFYLNSSGKTGDYAGGTTNDVYSYTIPGSTLSTDTYLAFEAYISGETVGAVGGVIWNVKVKLDGTTIADWSVGTIPEGVAYLSYVIRGKIFLSASNSIFVIVDYDYSPTTGASTPTTRTTVRAIYQATLDMSSDRALVVNVTPFNNYTTATYRGEGFKVWKVGKQ